MRSRPDGFQRALRLQWVCAALDRLLGVKKLAPVPVLLSGYGSILDHPAANAFAHAAFNLRQIGVDLSSEAMVRQAIADAATWEAENANNPGYIEAPYEIDSLTNGWPFRQRMEVDPRIDDMVNLLTQELDYAPWGGGPADVSRPFSIHVEEGGYNYSLPADLSALSGQLPGSTPYDVNRLPRGRIHIPLTELIALAEEMDALDAATPGRPPGNWRGRLVEPDGTPRVDILEPGAGGLTPAGVIRLEGLRHLIGLPGTGKTTLIVLLIVWLARRDYRTVVLLPSIETSLNLLGDLRFYGADPGLLVGQSPDTRLSHARKFAEKLTGNGDARGFGQTAPGADLLALGCALRGFVEETPEMPFPERPPCVGSIQQQMKKKDGRLGQMQTKRCPLSSVCGRQKASRELPIRISWLGHIMSTDTNVPPHFVDERLRYIELMAATADLVIVDEVDGAQSSLDQKAISELDLTGSVKSYDHALIRDLFAQTTSGRNEALLKSNVLSYSNDAIEFRRLNDQLTSSLQSAYSRDGENTPLAYFKDRLVTSAGVLSVLFSDKSADEDEAEAMRMVSLRNFWDGSIKLAMFNRTVDVDDDADMGLIDVSRIAADLSLDPDDTLKAHNTISRLTQSWLAENLPPRRDEHAKEMREVLFKLVPPIPNLTEAQKLIYFDFLLKVTALVVQFLRLVPGQRAMVAEGIHHESIMGNGISSEFQRLIPESLVGRLSGVRFRVETDEQNRRSIKLQYLAFKGTPRALLYRLHHLLRHEGKDVGPAVLLASATSFLEESPSYHIPIGPDYVLSRRAAEEGWRASEWRFMPIQSNEDPTKRLFLSGSPLHLRQRILLQMADHFYTGDNPLVTAMTQDFDPGRKVGFVVNSYEQVRQFKAWIDERYPALGRRTIAVTDRIPAGNSGGWVTTSQVERLGGRPESWDALIFPMKALARGVNIVFEEGPRRRDALLGTMVFLVRPHPATESLGFAAGLVGRSGNMFDQEVIKGSLTLDQLHGLWKDRRMEVLQEVRRLLRFPLQARRLGPLARPFTADTMVDVLQTIGRGLRNGCKVRAIFVDGAWAPLSANGKTDTPHTSMLAMMLEILRRRLSDPNPVRREVYRLLYEPFLDPLERCHGVAFDIKVPPAP